MGQPSCHISSLFYVVLSDKVPFYILDLLQQVPVVYVKGLGRFDAIFHPAILDVPAGKVHPPSLEAVFNGADGNESHLLAAYIRYVSGASMDMAEKAIESFAQSVRNHLQESGEFAIEGFGTFSMASPDNLRFTPDWNAFNLTFQNLETIPLREQGEIRKPGVITTRPVQPITDVAKEMAAEPEPVHTMESVETNVSQRPDIQPPSGSNIDEQTSRLWWIILASALILITILCGYLAWDILSNRQRLNDLHQIYPDTIINTRTNTVPDQIDTNQTATQNPVVETPASTSQPTPSPDTESTNTEPVKGSNKEENKPSQIQPSSQPYLKEPLDTSYCYIIVGAFHDMNNVTRMLNRLTTLGYESIQFDGGTLTKVAIKTACEKNNLQHILDEARANINPEAWIY